MTQITIDATGARNAISPKFYPLLKERARFLVLYGGAGSGKSHFAAQKILRRIQAGMELGVRQRFLCLRKTGPAARKSVFALLRDYIFRWGMGKIVQFNKTDMTIDFMGPDGTFGTGSQIYCGGLDEPEKLKSIEGVTSAWLEEPTEFKIEDFLELDRRIRGKTRAYQQIILSFNPISRLLWPHQLFFEAENEYTKQAVLHHSTADDNPFINADYITRTLDSLKGVDEGYYNVYRLGLWGVLKDLIYHNWDEVNELPAQWDARFYGIDWGYNAPTVFVEIRLWRGDLWIRELMYQTHLDPNEIISQMKRHLDPKYRIWADSEDPGMIKLARAAGFDIIPSEKGPGSVKAGIDTVKRFRLHITKDSVNGIKEMQGYKWLEKKDGEIKDEPLKFNDHFCDGFRYPIVGYFGRIPVKQESIRHVGF